VLFVTGVKFKMPLVELITFEFIVDEKSVELIAV